MPVKAITPDYHGDFQDLKDKYGPNQLLFVCWEKHTMTGWPMAVPLPPETPFGALVKDILPMVYGMHPDFEKIDWNAVQWSTAKGAFEPEMEKSIADHGFKHKTQIRFRTPGLDGHNGAG